MAHTACLVGLVSTVSGCHKNALRRGSASSGHITKLEQFTFFRYLCIFVASLKQNFFLKIGIRKIFQRKMILSIFTIKILQKFVTYSFKNFCKNIFKRVL